MTEYVDVEDLKVGADGTVVMFLTDKARFEYNTGSRLWRELNPEIELGQERANKFTVETTSG